MHLGGAAHSHELAHRGGGNGVGRDERDARAAADGFCAIA
jgi:hypothetical protein